MATYPDEITPKLREAAEFHENLYRLARHAGVGKATIWRIANGNRRMSYATARKIAAVYPKYTAAEYAEEQYKDAPLKGAKERASAAHG